MLRVIDERIIVESFVILYCSLVRQISGHVLCLYKALPFAALSLFPCDRGHEMVGGGASEGW